MKVGIIDYGMGNLFSVEQAVKRLGYEVIVSSNIQELKQADTFILPGVGAFADAIGCLEKTGLNHFVYEIAEQQKPLLGICLGMQLLFEDSEENGFFKGLGIFKGTIRRFDDEKVRVPHMGWNNLTFTFTPNWQEPEELADRYVYFVHSYYGVDLAPEQLVAYAEYERIRVPGIVQKGNVTGMQFHPEKSGTCGMTLLKNWLQQVEGETQS